MFSAAPIQLAFFTLLPMPVRAGNEMKAAKLVIWPSCQMQDKTRPEPNYFCSIEDYVIGQFSSIFGWMNHIQTFFSKILITAFVTKYLSAV